MGLLHGAQRCATPVGFDCALSSGRFLGFVYLRLVHLDHLPELVSVEVFHIRFACLAHKLLQALHVLNPLGHEVQT